MPRLTEEQKIRAVTLLENGVSLQRVADDVGVSKTGIYKLKRKWEETHTVAYVHGGGRHRISNQQQDHELITNLRNNPFTSTIDAIQKSNFPGSRWTAYRRIKSSELCNFSAARKCALTEDHKRNRLNFANTFVNEDDMWRNVVFTDEKVFQSAHNGNLCVYRPQNRYVKPTYNSGCFSVTVWGWISFEGPGVCWKLDEQLTSSYYCNVLENIMLPSVTQVHGNNYIYQQDNSPIHTARIVQQWFANNNINVVHFPAKSADLNPMENIWSILVEGIYKNNYKAHNKDDLWEAIEEAWETLENECIRSLILSMQNRLQTVVENNGSWTKY